MYQSNLIVVAAGEVKGLADPKGAVQVFAEPDCQAAAAN
jgi:hypothetical protein